MEVSRGEDLEIYGVRVCLEFARDVRHYQRMKRLSWHNLFESGPIKSRMGAFPDVFGMTNGRFKGTESRSEPRIRFRLATGEFGNYWCMFVK